LVKGQKVMTSKVKSIKVWRQVVAKRQGMVEKFQGGEVSTRKQIEMKLKTR
jgi:hypothetical protein